MTAQTGRLLLLKIGTGAGSPEVFETVAGLRLKQFQLNAEPVDVTHTDSGGAWRELLAAASVRSASVSGNGIFTDGSADERTHAAFFDQTTPNWQLIVPGFGTLEGRFQVTSLEYGGTHDGAVTFSIALQSAGPVSFTATP